MKHIIEFNMPEDEREMRCYIDSTKMYSVISELQEFLRRTIKYCDENDSDLKAYEYVREQLYGLLEDYSLNMDELL